MKAFITAETPVTDEVLNAIAYLPTKVLAVPCVPRALSPLDRKAIER